MAAPTGSDLETPQDQAPFGACRLAVEGSNLYWVRGNSGWHLVCSDTGECDCLHYIFRCSFRRGDLCKHGQALAEHLERERQCPTCKGAGWLLVGPQMHYVTRDGKRDKAPLACIVCSGSGRLTEEQMREVFE